MPTFIQTGRFTEAGIKGLIARPEDRSGVVAALVEAAGGRLVGFYLTSGDSDYLAITEFPDLDGAAAVAMAAVGSGAVCATSTRQTWSYAEFAKVATLAGRAAKAYTPPG